MKPTHVLKVLHKLSGATGVVGAGWENKDGSFSIRLNPATCLAFDESLVITLFPNSPHPARKSNSSDETCLDR
jgi:hypothetical protein